MTMHPLLIYYCESRTATRWLTKIALDVAFVEKGVCVSNILSNLGKPTKRLIALYDPE